MKWLDLGNSIGRFRFVESCVGLTGCMSICYAVWTPCWLANRGLWTDWNISELDQTRDDSESAVYNVPEAQRFFAVISFLMALSCGALCLIFALCWTSDTVHSYSNTRSLLMVGQALYPTTLLLFTLASTGLLFLLCWSLFTYHHREEIRGDIASLGSSYWLGAVGWALLLILQPTVFLAEQCVVPDILPDLENSIETWRRASLQKRAFSEGCHPGNYTVDDIAGLRRYMSEP